MGIKQFIEQKKCRTCGILIPSAWKYCTSHGSFQPYKKLKPNVSTVDSKLYADLTFHCNREKALQSEMLVYDENMHIIGYRSPLFKLKE